MIVVVEVGVFVNDGVIVQLDDLVNVDVDERVEVNEWDIETVEVGVIEIVSEGESVLNKEGSEEEKLKK